MGREGEETMTLILAIRGFLNGSDAATAYLALAVVTALDPGPWLPASCLNQALQMREQKFVWFAYLSG